VVERASSILSRLTRHEAPIRSSADEAPEPLAPPADPGAEEAASILRDLDADSVSPRAALEILYRLRSAVGSPVRANGERPGARHLASE